METKDKVLFVVFALLIVCATAVSYVKYMSREEIEFYTDEEAFVEALTAEE